MHPIRDQKDFQDLNFHVWLLKDEEIGKWRDEVYMKGDDVALQTIKNNLQILLDIFQMYGKGTKKFTCNPPSDFDPIVYGKEHGVTIRWLDQLVVRIGLDALDDEPFILEDFVVSVSVNPATMKIFIQRIQDYLDLTEKHGVGVVCGLRLSPDWYGS